MERVTGIEPVSRPWQGRIIPVYYTRKASFQLELSIYNLPIFNDFFNQYRILDLEAWPGIEPGYAVLQTAA